MSPIKKKPRPPLPQRTFTIREARQALARIRRELTEVPEIGALQITNRGKPALAVMSWDLYESITETLDILGDEAEAETLRQGLRELKEGKGIPWGKAKSKLEIDA